MAASSSPPRLADLLDVLVTDEAAAVRFVAQTPALARARVEADRLIMELPHQLYVGDTALHLAAAAVLPDAVAALIRSGADPNAANRRGASALHYACDPRPDNPHRDPTRQRRMIEQLLDAGAHIERRDKAGATPLHRAVRARSPAAVRCLLERGANVHATHGSRQTTMLQLATHGTGASGTRGAVSETEAIVEMVRRAAGNR